MFYQRRPALLLRLVTRLSRSIGRTKCVTRSDRLKGGSPLPGSTTCLWKRCSSAQPCCPHDLRFSLGCCRWTRRVSHTKRGRRYPEFTRSPTPLCSVILTRFLAKGLSGGRCRSWLTSRDRPRASLFAS